MEKEKENAQKIRMPRRSAGATRDEDVEDEVENRRKRRRMKKNRRGRSVMKWENKDYSIWKRRQ